VEVSGVELRWEHGLWLGLVGSRYGLVEAILNGTPQAPKDADVTSFCRFVERVDENIAALRRRVRFGFLYQPIRIAVNNESRVGVQFRHRLTGKQGVLILED
jgi:hypothetical protein